MRVLHLYAGNLYGGVERLLVTLAGAQSTTGAMERHFGLCFEGRLSTELLKANAPVYQLGTVRFRHPWTMWAARRRLTKLLSEVKFDVVLCHSCWPHALFAPTVRSTRVPLVFWAHDVPNGTHPLERLAKWTPPDLVIANSHYTKGLAIAKLFPGVPAEVIHHPLRAPDSAQRMLNRELIRAELGTDAQATVIVIASRMEPLKGHHILLEALRQMSELPNWECWVVGGVQRPQELAYLEGLRSSTAASGIASRVRFLGERRDIPQVLAAADIYCQPNVRPEAFGVSFVEALHAGLPVVTTAIGGATEIITNDCGVLVPPGDPTAVARALQTLIQDRPRRQALGESGPGRAASLCNFDRQLAMLDTCLSKLCDAHNSAEAARAGNLGLARGAIC